MPGQEEDVAAQPTPTSEKKRKSGDKEGDEGGEKGTSEAKNKFRSKVHKVMGKRDAAKGNQCDSHQNEHLNDDDKSSFAHTFFSFRRIKLNYSKDCSLF